MTERCLCGINAFSSSSFAAPVSRLRVRKTLGGDTASTADWELIILSMIKTGGRDYNFKNRCITYLKSRETVYKGKNLVIYKVLIKWRQIDTIWFWYLGCSLSYIFRIEALWLHYSVIYQGNFLGITYNSFTISEYLYKFILFIVFLLHAFSWHWFQQEALSAFRLCLFMAIWVITDL